MTVIFSKKCELALQAVLFLSTQDAITAHNAAQISEKLGVPKEFVAKVLQQLAIEGIVGSKKGKNGGFFLKRPANSIHLIDIVLAIDGLDVFHKCVLGFKGCSMDKPCPVHEKWGKLRDETYRMLSEETLAELRDKTIVKIEGLKEGEESI
jgi:Rrf2 family protein